MGGGHPLRQSKPLVSSRGREKSRHRNSPQVCTDCLVKISIRVFEHFGGVVLITLKPCSMPYQLHNPTANA